MAACPLALEEVAQLASSELDGVVDSRSLSDLCQLHDELLLVVNSDRETSHRIGPPLPSADTGAGAGGLIQKKSVMQCQVSPSALTSEMFATEADMYRAVLFLSRQLLSRWLSSSSSSSKSLSSPVSESLHRTIQQSELLLQILAVLYSLWCGTSTNMLEQLPTQYPALVECLECLDPPAGENDNHILISSLLMDPHALAAEEEELLRMANAPIPSEHPQRKGCISDENHPAKRRYVGSIDSSRIGLGVVADNHAVVTATVLHVELDPHRGVLRLIGDNVSSSTTVGWWAALTASSEIQGLSPSFVMTNLVIRDGNEATIMSPRLKLVDSLEVQLLEPKDSPQWGDATTAVIQQLKQLRTLHQQVHSLWGTDKLDDHQVIAADGQVANDATIVSS